MRGARRVFIPLCLVALSLAGAARSFAEARIAGRVSDPSGQAVAGATVQLKPGPSGSQVAETRTDEQGQYAFTAAPGAYELAVEAPGFVRSVRTIGVRLDEALPADLNFDKVAPKTDNIVVTATTTEPTLDLRNAEVFDRTLFTRACRSRAG